MKFNVAINLANYFVYFSIYPNVAKSAATCFD